MMNGHDNTINDIILKGSAPCGRPLAVLQSYSGGEEATKKLLAGFEITRLPHTCSADSRQMCDPQRKHAVWRLLTAGSVIRPHTVYIST